MTQNEKMIITGPEGELEALVNTVDGSEVVSVICHPHPLYQGTMNNKVVTTMAKACDQVGVSSIRFNYRGVGNSAGSYGEMEGEVQDCLAVIAHAQQLFPGQRLALSGFSFGSYIASRAAEQHDSEWLVTVAPAVNHARFNDLSDIDCPWLVVMGSSDEVVPFDQVLAWADNPPAPLSFEVIEGASHFFHGDLIELRQMVVDFIKAHHAR
ncbi:MAG: alpha/beta hydrolase [Coxiellaceae bacterium]|nr:alpha/beta hydrolase [Coxiellaceae bacterium]